MWQYVFRVCVCVCTLVCVIPCCAGSADLLEHGHAVGHDLGIRVCAEQTSQLLQQTYKESPPRPLRKPGKQMLPPISTENNGNIEAAPHMARTVCRRLFAHYTWGESHICQQSHNRLTKILQASDLLTFHAWDSRTPRKLLHRSSQALHTMAFEVDIIPWL